MIDLTDFGHKTGLVPRRILIIGGPRCGKTTYANQLGETLNVSVLHFDDFIDLSWSQLSEKIAAWLNEPGPWIMEGIQGVRGLRKWLRANPEALIPFEVHLVSVPKVKLTPGQESMYKACKTIFTEILPELRKRDAKFAEVF